MNMNYTAGEIAAIVCGKLCGDSDLVITDARGIDNATPSDISYINSREVLKQHRKCQAGVLLIQEDLADAVEAIEFPSVIIFVADAEQSFLHLLETANPQKMRPSFGISPEAFVSPTATIGEGTNIFPGAHIKDGVTIGANCDIHVGVVIGEDCRIGDNVTIHPNVVLYEDIEIGNRVIIHATSVIGADGFGYRLENGKHIRIPHYGTVRIEDDVEIGACTTIDRAKLGATVIGEGSKIDNLVQIAHNCEIGKHNIFVGQVGLAGSVTSGDYVVCAGHVGIADHVHLGTGCVLGSKSGVPKDVPAGETYIGIPAQPVADAMRMMMAQRKIPEMRTQLKELKKQVEHLTAIATNSKNEVSNTSLHAA